MSDQFPESFVRLDTFSSAVWYRTKGGRYRLEGTRCSHCGETFFPPRTGLICPSCRQRAMVSYECAGSGELVDVAHPAEVVRGRGSTWSCASTGARTPAPGCMASASCWTGSGRPNRASPDLAFPEAHPATKKGT